MWFDGGEEKEELSQAEFSDKHWWRQSVEKFKKSKRQKAKVREHLWLISIFFFAIQPLTNCVVLFKAEQMTQKFTLSQQGFNPKPALSNALLVLPSYLNYWISSPGVYFAYQLQIENHDQVIANVYIENTPKGQTHVSGFKDFSILAFLIAALWRKRKAWQLQGMLFWLWLILHFYLHLHT